MGGEPPPGYSSGGMRTKLVAARIATQAGCAMAIALGHRDHPLRALAEGARCTWFLPAPEGRSARKRWIAGTLQPAGTLRGRCRRGPRAGAGRLAAAGRRARASTARSSAATRWWSQGPDGARLARGPVGLWQRRRAPHRRPPLARRSRRSWAGAAATSSSTAMIS